jgi:hypothetical protein
MLNYVVDARLITLLLPAETEIDFDNGETFLSVVGFQFLDTRPLGLPIPLHRDFEEVNLNLPTPALAPVPGFAKDGGKNVKTKDGKEKNFIPVSTAEYNPCGWRAWLNNTTLTLGMQNVLDADPPFVAGNFENGYDESLATIKGRFWYVQLKKRF